MKRKMILAAAAALLAAACAAVEEGEEADMLVKKTWAMSDASGIQPEYEFAVTADVSWPVLRSCERLTLHQDSCWSVVLADCSALARVLVPEAADVLDCTARQTGEGCFLDCWAPEAMGDAGTRVCSAWSAACESEACENSWSLFFDVLSPWMRPGVVEALETCLDETGCENLTRCINAWSRAAGFSLIIG
jgi:hypothetical protein